MSERSSASEDENRRRLDQMEDVIQSMITLTLEQSKMYDRQREQMIAEIREQRTEIQDLPCCRKSIAPTSWPFFSHRRKASDRKVLKTNLPLVLTLFTH